MRVTFVGGIALYSLREAIQESAESVEDEQVIIRNITQELEQTNWSQLIAKKQAEKARREEKYLNRQVSCKRCKQKFKFRELKRIEVAWGFGSYCAVCF